MKEKNSGIGNRLKHMCAAAAAAILLVVMLLSAALLAGKYCRDQRGKAAYQLTRKIAGVEEREDGEEQETDIPVPLRIIMNIWTEPLTDRKIHADVFFSRLPILRCLQRIQ